MLFAAREKYIEGFFCVVFVADALFGAHFLIFGIERFASFENWVEPVAVFLCLRSEEGLKQIEKGQKIPVPLLRNRCKITVIAWQPRIVTHRE